MEKTLSGYDEHIYGLTWSPDGRRIAAANSHCVRIRDIMAGFASTLATDKATLKNTVSWSPTGKHLAVGGNDKLVHIWNVASKKETFAYHGHTNYVIAAAWAPDGSRIASAGVDRTIQVWRAI